jgi:Protein of unknown function (DUF3300)
MNARFIVAALVALFVACGAAPERSTARAQSVTQFTSVDQLLAPIALYPDQLLAQILLSASDPAAIGKLDQFLKSNQQIKGTALQDAAVKAGFEPSLVALAVFPQIVTKMATEIAWTTQLGQVFVADRSVVFAGIQRLRKQAHDIGTLKTTSQQEVTTQTTSGGENVIVIEPSNPQVVYVPQYNPQVVYTTAPTTVTTVVVQDTSADAAVAAGLIGFTAGIAIGAAVNNNYYYGPYGYHGGGYMYNDAWDDYYDAREDAREDWQDHREDLADERGDRAENARENRTDRTETRSDTRGSTQEQRTERQQNRTENPQSSTQRAQGASTQGASTQSATTKSRAGSAEARGYGDGSTRQKATTTTRSGGSDAFSGYSSGQSQRSSSARGNSSRGSSRGGGGRRR